jgi:hypothetical protein
MKYKLYAIKNKDHPYFKEIRGIRYEYQYHQIPDCAQWIDKEYDDGIDFIPQFFHKDELGNVTNFARWKANDDFTDILSIEIDEMKASDRYKDHIKEEKVKKLLSKKIQKLELDNKRTALARIRIDNPNLADHVDKLKTKLDEEDTNDN